MTTRSDKPLPISRGNSHDFLIDMAPGNLSRCSSRDILAGLLPNFQKKSQFLDLATDDVLSGFAFLEGMDHGGDFVVESDKYSPSKCMKGPAISRILSAHKLDLTPKGEVAEIPREDYDNENFELGFVKEEDGVAVSPGGRPRAPTVTNPEDHFAALAEVDKLIKGEVSHLEPGMEDDDDVTVGGVDEDGAEDPNMAEVPQQEYVEQEFAEEEFPCGKESDLPIINGTAKPSWWTLNKWWSEIPKSERRSEPPPEKIGAFTLEERAVLLDKFRKKRLLRNFNRKATYQCRQHLANKRPRVKGRFVKQED